MSTRQQTTLELIEHTGIVPLVTLHTPDEAVPLAEALLLGGIPIVEITFRSDTAVTGMKEIHKALEEMVIIAGTVHTIQQAQQAVDSGCSGIVTPSFDSEVVDWCLSQNVLILPGTAVPSDIEQVYDRGLRHAKFFPAQAYGGTATLRALEGPFAEMSFLPTGGITLENAAEFMELHNVFALGGSFPVPQAAHNSHDWSAITAAAATSCKLVRDTRAAHR